MNSKLSRWGVVITSVASISLSAFALAGGIGDSKGQVGTTGGLTCCAK